MSLAWPPEVCSNSNCKVEEERPQRVVEQNDRLNHCSPKNHSNQLPSTESLHLINRMVSVRKLYLLPGIFTNGGFELLGSFVGSLSFCESSDLMRVEKIQAILVLRDFHDSHGNHSLWSCLVLSRLLLLSAHVPWISYKQLLQLLMT